MPTQKFKYSLTKVRELWRINHPDYYVSDDAKKVFQKMLEEKTEKQVMRIMDLAGDVARWEDGKRTCEPDHVKRAIAYIDSNTVAVARRKHNAASKNFIQQSIDPRNVKNGQKPSNSCPKKRRPSNGECAEQDMVVRTNKQGNPCCYKTTRASKAK